MNHPPKGSKIKVEPIKRVRDINAIKKMLSGEPRNLALSIIGINTALRASDLARLTVGQVRYLKAGDTLEIKEKKTSKNRQLTLNNSCVKAIKDVIEADKLDNHDPLFKSRKGCQLTVQSMHRLVKGWCRAINLKGNYGSHTLRKTFGYHRRVTFGRGLPELCELFGHASQRITLEYLCIQPEEIKDIYMDEL
jgi:integrase